MLIPLATDDLQDGGEVLPSTLNCIHSMDSQVGMRTGCGIRHKNKKNMNKYNKTYKYMVKTHL
jgi:hypothetical protein